MNNELIGVISNEGELKGVLEDNSFNVIVQITESGPQGIQGPKGDKGDQGEQGIPGLNGKSLEFHWNGTSLGIRIEGEATYQYVDLKGEKGDKGEKGNPGIVYQPEEPTDPDTLVWISDEDSPVLDPETLALKQDLDALESDLATHIEDDISQGELHGFRLNQDKKLEYFNGIEYVEVKGGGYPVNIVKNVTAIEGNGEVKLMWEDPDDVIVDGVTIAKWNHTKVMRKVGSYPLHEEDGELVVSNGVRNAYKDTPYSDTGLQNDTTYYYAMFPITTEGIVTISEVSRVSATPGEIKIYGVEIDEDNSNPETSVVYTDDAVGFTPMSGNDGNFQWGSWQSIFNNLGIKPVMLKDGIEQYELNPNDFSKKLDGSSADITSGNDGDVMIKFPKIYWKINKVGSKLQVKFSTKEFEGAICKAHTVGSSEKEHIYISA